MQALFCQGPPASNSLAQQLVPPFTLLHLFCMLSGAIIKSEARDRVVGLLRTSHIASAEMVEQVLAIGTEAWEAAWEVAVGQQVMLCAVGPCFYVNPKWRIHIC